MVGLIVIVAIVIVATLVGCIEEDQGHTPTPATTSTATATPGPSPAPTPLGFEAVFAIAGILVVAYLLRRRR